MNKTVLVKVDLEDNHSHRLNEAFEQVDETVNQHNNQGYKVVSVTPLTASGNYYDNTDALIYVVDSADEGRMTELKGNLEELLAEEQLANVPLLVFANKQDLDLALGADEVCEALELNNISDRTWNIQACSAVSQEGLQEGCDWLI